VVKLARPIGKNRAKFSQIKVLTVRLRRGILRRRMPRQRHPVKRGLQKKFGTLFARQEACQIG